MRPRLPGSIIQRVRLATTETYNPNAKRLSPLPKKNGSDQIDRLAVNNSAALLLAVVKKIHRLFNISFSV